MKLHERGPPLSLAEWTGLAPIGEHPAADSPSHSPPRPAGTRPDLAHSPAGHLPRDQPPGAGRAGGTAAPPGRGPSGPSALPPPPGARQLRTDWTPRPACPLRPVAPADQVHAFLNRAGTDPAGPPQPQKAILRPIASATSAERPQHRDHLAAGHGHSGAELPRRHYSLRCWPGLTAPAPAVPGRLLCQPRIRSLIVTTEKGRGQRGRPCGVRRQASRSRLHRHAAPALRLVTGTRLPPRVPVTPAQTKRARQA
jgi:hypothetical protein